MLKPSTELELIWAKKGDPAHSLLAHLLDTAAVAHALLRREPPASIELYEADWKLYEEQALRWVAFLVGLHDLGKASPVFQCRWPERAAQLWEVGLRWDKERVGRDRNRVAHGVFTELFVRRLLVEDGLPPKVAAALGRALGAHHGFTGEGRELKIASIHLGLEEGPWWEARRQLVERLKEDLDVALPKVREVSPAALLRVAALASFTDWIASDPDFFPYGRSPTAPEFFQKTLKMAERALDRLNWHPLKLEPKPFAEIFPFPPNSLQAVVSHLLSEVKVPVLLLIEAPMGMGKTEAALYASHILQSQVGHRGFYLALPTQATSNGLFPRVKLPRFGGRFTTWSAGMGVSLV